MHEPKDLLKLLDQQGDDFDFKTYLENFAPYWYTYIAGYAALVDTLVVAAKEFRNHKSVLRYISGQSELAVGRIPVSWKSDFDSKDWNECTIAQVSKAFNGEPLRLDKACLAVKSLELAFAGAFPSFLAEHDFYSFVRLRPAIYVLRGLEPDDSATLQSKRKDRLHDELVAHICAHSHGKPGAILARKAKGYLYSVVQGYPITHPSARLIRDFLGNHISIAAIENRSDNGRIKKTCNLQEASFISLDKALMEVLRKIQDDRR